MAVYDKENENTQKSLGASALRSAEDDAGFAKNSFDTAERNEQNALRNNGLSAGFDSLRKLPNGRLKRAKSVFFGSKKKSIATTAVLGGGVIGGVMGIVLVLMPALKIPSAVDLIEKAFFANTNQIGDTVAERMMTQYIIKKVVPGMVENKCTSTKVDRSCANASSDSTYVGKIYNSWRDAKLEKKLYDKYGLEISREGSRWYITTTDLKERIALGDFDGSEGQRQSFERSARQALSATEARTAVKSAFEGETRWKSMLTRYQAGKLLERKYGIARCLIACGSRDKAREWIATNPAAERAKSGRAWLNNRVVGKYSESLALAMSCMMDRHFSCADATTDEDGFKRSKFQTELRAAAIEYRNKYGSQALEDMLKESDSIREQGIVAHYTEKLISKAVGDTAGKATVKVASKAIPVLGWIDLGVNLSRFATVAPVVYPMLTYAINSEAMVSTFATYALARDEIQAGDGDLAMYGSLSETLDANSETENGGMGAESSPVFQLLTGAEEITPTTCQNGQKPEGNWVICPEQRLTPYDSQTAMLAGGLKGILDPLGTQALWDNTVGRAFTFVEDLLGGVLEKLPGYEAAVAKASEILGGVFQFFIEKFIPPVMTAQSSGARIFDTVAGGGAVLAQDMCQNMGCMKTTTLAYAESSLAYIAKEDEAFRSQSAFARVFSTEDSRSLISKIALSTPLSGQGITTAIAGALSSPIGLVGNSLANISAQKTSAMTSEAYSTYFAQMGLAAQGYPADSQFLSSDDYEAYEAELNCSNPEDPNNMKAWAETAVQNDRTGQYEYTTTNPCLGLKAMSCSMAGIYKDELCADTNLEAPEENSDGGADGTGGGFGTSTDMRALAQQVLANQNITLNTGFDNPRRQMQNLAAGTNSPSCNISPRILNMILYIARTHTIYITSINRYCAGMQTASGNYSFHWKGGGGHAVDIGIVDGVKSTGGTAKDLALLREVIPLLPSGAEVGQIQCRPRGSAGPLPTGVIEFNDSCNHIHIALPVYEY